MKRISLFLCTLLACFLMTSCYVTNYVPLQDDYNQAYKGHSANEIITQYGAPDRQTDDGAGGRILIYEKITYNNNASSSYNPYSGGYDASSSMTTKTTYLQFYVNKDNVCYGVKTNLEKMERQKIARTKPTLKEVLLSSGIGMVLGIAVFLLSYK